MRRVVAALVLALALAPVGRALDIVNYSSNTHDRFVPGTYPAAPQENSNFWFSSMDWSGVGWNVGDPHRSVAMISPKHFVAAAHFSIGGSLSFINSGGTQMTFSVSGTQNFLTDPVTGQPSDLYIGELTSAIPAASNILSYAVMDLGATNDYVGLPLWVYGFQPSNGVHFVFNSAVGLTVGTNTFDGFENANGQYLFYYDQDNATGEAQGEAGDSGSPTFTMYGSTLALLGTHYAIDDGDPPTYTFDTFIPNFIDQISDILAADGYSLALVPEPGQALPLMAAGAGLLLWLRRRRG